MFMCMKNDYSEIDKDSTKVLRLLCHVNQLLSMKNSELFLIPITLIRNIKVNPYFIIRFFYT